MHASTTTDTQDGETPGELVSALAVVDVDATGREVAPLERGRWLLPAGELFVAAQAAPNTERTYRSTLRSFALFLQTELGVAPTVDALMLSTVVDYKRHLAGDDPATGRPRAQSSTIAKQLSALRGFARWLSLDVDLGADVDPRIQLVKVNRGDPPLPRALTPDELRRVLATPDRGTTRGKRDLALLEILARAGLRRAEAATVRWEHLLRVERWPDGQTRSAVAAGPAEETTWAIRVEHSKRGRSRTVPFAAPVVRALQDWRRTGAASAAQRAGASATIFVSLPHPRAPDSGGEPLSPAAVGDIATRYTRAAGVPAGRQTAHALRHTFCTAVASRSNLEVVSRLAGHADVRTSARYVDVTDARASAAIANTFDAGTFDDAWG
jgi:integrase